MKKIKILNLTQCFNFIYFTIKTVIFCVKIKYCPIIYIIKMQSLYGGKISIIGGLIGLILGYILLLVSGMLKTSPYVSKMHTATTYITISATIMISTLIGHYVGLKYDYY